jgi:uncharacterized protein (DUF486 family)
MKILIVFLQWALKTRLRALVSMLVLLVIVGWVAALVQNAMKTPEQRAAERTHQQEAAVAATVERDRKRWPRFFGQRIGLR